MPERTLRSIRHGIAESRAKLVIQDTDMAMFIADTLRALCRNGSLAVAVTLALHSPAEGRPTAVLATQLNTQLDEGYRVASGDKLRVIVFGEPALTGEYLIGAGGELSLPLIDAIAAGGQTTKTLALTISEKLKDGGYVLVPKVAVEIIEHRPFYILGEVKLPGEYPYNGNMTFEQAVARAGGFTPRANRRTILLRRQEWTTEQQVKLNGPALKIAPGDTIMVKESFF